MEEPIYGHDYLCYYNDEYLGIATYLDDPHIGESFIKLEVHQRGGLREIAIMPDKWIIFSGEEY